MKSKRVDHLHLSIIFSVFILLSSSLTPLAQAAHRCLVNQQSSLMQFKVDSFQDSSLPTWKPSTDCCSWQGVTCNNSTGQVVSLDLKNRGFEGRLYSNSSLFKLVSLQRLDLSDNYFAFIPFDNNVVASNDPNGTGTWETATSPASSASISPFGSPDPRQILIPSTFAKLSKLTHLNLASTSFSGQIPLELSHLTRLMFLDLSFNGLQLENPNLKMLVQKMSRLKELRLDGVDMSSGNIEWSTPLSSFVPNLRILSLSGCSISGPLLPSLPGLHFISDINLSNNNLSTEVPRFLGNYSSLISIDLSYCELRGEFPESIFKLPYLQTLELSFNPNLHGSLPQLPRHSALQHLSLSSTSFYGKLTESISNLENLTLLSLDNCNFSGPIPNGISKPSQLAVLDLSANNFDGPIPSLEGGLQKLLYLNLQNNSLDGVIHYSLFMLPLLKHLSLRENRFNGLPSEIPNTLSPILVHLDLSENSLQGPVPQIVFELKSLEELNLSSNNLSGIVDMDIFAILKNLTMLSLSDNPFSIKSSSNIPFPKLWKLELRSCSISEFPPFLRNLRELDNLDLSNNKIKGHIPKWIWLSTLSYLNLSHNLLTDIDQPLPNVRLIYLDLSSNNLNGPIPLLSRYASFLDYSNNNFSSIIPTDISSYLSNATFFSVSSNHLVGDIPESICSSEYLQVLDLSNNALSGKIPTCLGEFSKDLSVLNLGGNGFWGTLPMTYTNSLRSLVFNGNLLEGTVPRSLSDCTLLEVLDLGNNKISDIFPFWLDNLPNLQVLVLRSNRFHGPIQHLQTEIAFPKLHVIDLSSNGFVGLLPSEYFHKWKGMTEIEGETTQVKYLGSKYYHDSVTVTIKGRDMLLSRILTIFTSFDLSNNKFEGGIAEIGELKALIVLNLSHNGLAGHIPLSLENLRQLESLDLSENKLSGEIPWGLTSLTFLSVLNLARNRLEGTIPQGRQFNTFPISSYEGNEGLCGFPLPRKCRDSVGVLLPGEENESDSGTEFDWKFILIGYGGGVVAGLSVGYVFVWRNDRCFGNTAKRKRRVGLGYGTRKREFQRRGN